MSRKRSHWRKVAQSQRMIEQDERRSRGEKTEAEKIANDVVARLYAKDDRR